MDGSRKWAWGASTLLAFLGAGQAQGMDGAVESARPRAGVVTARSPSFDGPYREETGNCLLWTVGGRTYTLGDLHTVMTGEAGASDRVADQIQVKVGKRSSRARLVWPREGQRDVRQLDIAILELEGGLVGQPFEIEAFQAAPGSLPKELYLVAPGHRSKIIPIDAPAVAYGSQWFFYRELSPGDSGGMVFAVQDGRVVPYGLVSSTGSLPGGSARGTVVYGSAAMRIAIRQFLQASGTTPFLRARKEPRP
jgi:hypothetical protein